MVSMGLYCLEAQADRQPGGEGAGSAAEHRKLIGYERLLVAAVAACV